MQPLVPLVFHNLPSLYPPYLEEMIFYTCRPSTDGLIADMHRFMVNGKGNTSLTWIVDSHRHTGSVTILAAEYPF